MMPHPQIAVRPLLENELQQATRWAVEEEWNPSPHDSFVLNHADPGSMLTVEVRGKAAGVISAVRMTPGFGYLGFFVLCPSCRQLGYGWRLLRAGFQRLGERVIGGDGELDHLRGYARFGLLPRHLNVSYEGLVHAAPRTTHPAIHGAGIVPAKELHAYDAANFGVSRAAFLSEWMALPASRTLTFERDGRIAGFIAARRCHRGIRIGPFQADDPEAAEALLDAIAACFPGEILSVDCPETNREAAPLLHKKGLSPKRPTARLYRGEPPRGRPEKIYGLMSFTLG